jgi:hypothetical protein
VGALLHDRLPSVTTNVTRQKFRKREPAAGTRTLRAAHRTWRRLLVADFLPDSGHSRSITCSRCMRWPGSKDSSLTRLAAFLSRHASASIYLEPTLTRKLPSNQIRIASGLSSLSAWGLPRAFKARKRTHPLPLGVELPYALVHFSTISEHTPMNPR